MSVNCSALSGEQSQNLCGTMEGAGAGLGVFFQYLVAALPGFILILALIGGVVAIVWAVAGVIKSSIGGGMHRR
jgi:hypothetical protein